MTSEIELQNTIVGRPIRYSLPLQDPFEDGDVLLFTKQFTPETTGRVYNYAALRAVGQWYTTAATNSPGLTWEKFREFVAESRVMLAVAWELVRPNWTPEVTSG